MARCMLPFPLSDAILKEIMALENIEGVHIMTSSKEPTHKQPQIINYLSDHSYLREIGDYSSNITAIEYIYSKAKHGLEQIVPPLVESTIVDLDDYDKNANEILECVHAADKESLKYVLVEMANVIARLTHSFENHKSLEAFKAILIENLVFEAIDFTEQYPELLP